MTSTAAREAIIQRAIRLEALHASEERWGVVLSASKADARSLPETDRATLVSLCMFLTHEKKLFSRVSELVSKEKT